jgi:hypothetical protein
MSSRGTALALALLLIATVATAARGECCTPSGLTEQQVGGMDCCADASECPARLQAVSSAVVPGAVSVPTTGLVSVDSLGSLDSAPRLSHLTGSEPSFTPLSGGPPLYRLHSQLLI